MNDSWMYFMNENVIGRIICIKHWHPYIKHFKRIIVIMITLMQKEQWRHTPYSSDEDRTTHRKWSMINPFQWKVIYVSGVVFYVIFLDPHPNDEDIFNWKQQWIFSSESNKQKIHSLFFKAKFTAIFPQHSYQVGR